MADDLWGDLGYKAPDSQKAPAVTSGPDPALKALVASKAAQYGIPADIADRWVHAESAYDPKATSKKGARGLTQLMPKTADTYGVKDVEDPEQNVEGGAHYLADLKAQFGSWDKALAAYNAGPGAVTKAGGVPDYPETQAYVKTILGDQPAASGDDDLWANLGYDPKTTPAAPVVDGAKFTGAAGDKEVTPVTPHKSEALGFEKGLYTPVNNLSHWMEGGMRKFLSPDTMGELANAGAAIRKVIPQGVSRFIDNPQSYYDAQAKKGVLPGGAGEIAGNVIGAIPTLYLTKNPALAGAAGGILTTNKPDDLGGVAKDALFGALGGKLADVGLNKLSGAIAPKLSASVQKLLGEGVHLTPGQIMGGLAKSTEDKLTSFPILGDMIQGARGRGMASFNIAALNRVLKPLGDSLPKDAAPGHEAIAATSQKVSDAYNSLLSGVTVKADKTFSQALGKIAADAKSALPPDRAAQFAKITRDLLTTKLSKGGAMTGEGVKQFESRLGQLISKFGSSTDGDQQILAGHLGEVQSELRDLVGRSNPVVASRLKDINAAFANLVRVQKAAGSVAAEHGVFTPAMLVNAAKSADTSARKSATAKGTALMQDFAAAAKEVMPSKVPDSGTPGRLLMNLITGAGLTGGTALHMVNPAAVAAGGAATLPYTKVGGKIATKLLTARPAGAQGVADAVAKLRAPVIIGGAAAANQSR